MCLYNIQCPLFALVKTCRTDRCAVGVLYTVDRSRITTQRNRNTISLSTTHIMLCKY